MRHYRGGKVLGDRGRRTDDTGQKLKGLSEFNDFNDSNDLNERSDRTNEVIERLIPDPRALIPALLTAAMLLLPAVAVGQTKSTFTPRVSVSETYDDNIDLEPDNENSDWITVLSPGANFQLQSQYTQLALDYEAGFSFYAKHSSRDATRHQPSALVNIKLEGKIFMLLKMYVDILGIFSIRQ